MFETRVLRSTADKEILRKDELEDEFFYFDLNTLESRTYLVVLEGDVIVGMAALSENTIWAVNAIGVGFFETHADHRQRGVSKLLVAGLFQLARDLGKTAIVNSGYAPDGLRWLRPLIHATSDLHPDIDFSEF